MALLHIFEANEYTYAAFRVLLTSIELFALLSFARSLSDSLEYDEHFDM